jgi:hypothetical protein
VELNGMLKISFFLSSLLIFGWSAKAQEVQASEAYLALYQEQLPFFQELITGGLYADSPRNFDGHPFFQTRVFGNGVLRINEVNYESVPLLYDSQADWVITFHPIHKQKILIKSEKVAQFELQDGTKFRNFGGNSSYSHHRNGFYEIISDGRIKVLAKHYKELKPVKELGEFTKEFVAYKDLFYWFDGKFEAVSRKSQAINLLGLDKKEAKHALKASNLDFRRDMEKALGILAELRAEREDSFKGFSK